MISVRATNAIESDCLDTKRSLVRQHLPLRLDGLLNLHLIVANIKSFRSYEYGITSVVRNLRIIRVAMLASWVLAPCRAADVTARSVDVAVEHSKNGAWTGVDLQNVFRPDDQIRFRFRANFGGFLYVLNLTSRGEYMWLFPQGETGVDNRIEAKREYLIPATNGAFRIPPDAGYDRVYWIVSSLQLPALPRIPNRGEVAGERPRVRPESPLLPRCKDGPLKARGVCLDDEAGVQRLQSAGDVPAQLPFNVETDLLKQFTIRQDPAAARVNGPDTGPFVYQLVVAHRAR